MTITWRKTEGKYIGSVLGHNLYLIWYQRTNGIGGRANLWHLGFRRPDGRYHSIKMEFGAGRYECGNGRINDMRAAAEAHFADTIKPLIDNAIDTAIADAQESAEPLPEGAVLSMGG